jgi:hypothetical protein
VRRAAPYPSRPVAKAPPTPVDQSVVPLAHVDQVHRLGRVAKAFVCQERPTSTLPLRDENWRRTLFDRKILFRVPARIEDGCELR